MTTGEGEARLRVHPRKRFAQQVSTISLEQAYRDLPGESRGQHGHMQKALYRHGAVTGAIFFFEAGSGLREHDVEAEAIIHVLDGRVKINAEGQEYTMGPHDLMLLAPGVPHDLQAEVDSKILLTVVLERD